MSQFHQGPGGPVLKPLDLGQLLDRSFRVFGQSWKPLMMIGLIAAIPGVLISLFSLSLTANGPKSAMPAWMYALLIALEEGDPSALIAFVSTMGLLALILWLLVPLYTGALIDVSARAVLGMPAVSLGESLRVAAGHYFRLLGTAILAILIYIGGVIACILAGFVFLAFITVPLGIFALSIFLMFANHAIVMEGAGGGGPAIGRSFSLVKTRFWPLLGYSFIFYLMIIMVQSMITFPLSMVAGIISAITESFAAISIVYLIQGLVSAVLTPFMMVGRTLMYVDTRIRREGFDLQMMAQQQAAPHEPFQ